MTQNMDRSEETESECFVYDDGQYHSAILDNLNMLRKNRQFCDVVLQIGNNQDVHEIYAHKVVLSSASPYLLELFSNDSSAAVQYKLLNGNYDVESFDYVIDYAYTAKLEVPKSKVRDVYAVANRLKMSSVVFQCGQYLMSTLTPENCLDVRAIRGVLRDQFLLNSVDNYIRQNMPLIVQSKCLDGLPKIHMEFLLNSEEERAATNEKHVLNMIVDWIKVKFDKDELNSTSVSEKMFMLYYDKMDKLMHDCNELDMDSTEDSDIIQDYKKLSRRLSFPTKSSNGVQSQNEHQNGVHKHKSKPLKSRQFLFTRSDSESSLSSIAEEDNENDWKVVSSHASGKDTLLGLVIVMGKVFVLSVKLRINSPSNSPHGSRHHSLEKSEPYCLIPPMNSARCAVGTAELNGKLFVCGGYDRGECLKTVEAYDRETNKWDKLNQMKVPRGRFDITVVDGIVYAIGGSDGQNELDSAEMYDSVSLNWAQIPSCPVVRSNAGVCNLNGKVFVIGGWNGSRGLNRCDAYDPKTQHWSEIKPLNIGRYQTGVTVLNDVIYAVGGCDSWTCLNSAERYMNNIWQTITPLNTARRGCGVAAFNGKLYVVGGHDGVHALCSVEIYDPITEEWTAGPPLTCCRANVGVCVVGNRLYAVGGFDGKIFLSSIEFLDYEANEWTNSVEKCALITRNGVNGNKLSNGKRNENECSNKYLNNGNGFDGQLNHSSYNMNFNDEPLLEVEESSNFHS